MNSFLQDFGVIVMTDLTLETRPCPEFRRFMLFGRHVPVRMAHKSDFSKRLTYCASAISTKLNSIINKDIKTF